MCPQQDPELHRRQQQPGSALPRSARILWLHRQEPGSDILERQLLAAFQSSGARLQVVDVASLTSIKLEEADLVLMDAFEKMEADVETLVARVRIESKVPLVMLTRKQSADQLVMALQAGADAIWSLESATSILLAHCRALLRRWQR